MRNAITIFLIIAAAVAGWYIGNQRTGDKAAEQTTVTTNDVSVPSSIRGIGKLQPKTGVLKVMAPMGQKIESLYDLEIGSSVDLDQPVVKLAGGEQAHMELEVAKARRMDAEKTQQVEKADGRLKREAAKLALADAKAKRNEVMSQGKGITLLEAQLKTAKEMYQRLHNLRAQPRTRKLVGQTDVDKQRLVVQQLETKIAQSEEDIRLAMKRIERAEQAAQLDIERLDSMLGQSALPENTFAAAEKAANTAIEMLDIKSPVDGTVLDIVVQPGNTVTNQPVMLVGDTSKMVCIAEINDTSLAKVQIGAATTITSNAIGSALTGKVVSKGIMIGPPSMKDPNPFSSVDRKTGKVVIELDQAEIASQFVNLQVDVEIEPVMDDVNDSADPDSELEPDAESTLELNSAE